MRLDKAIELIAADGGAIIACNGKAYFVPMVQLYTDDDTDAVARIMQEDIDNALVEMIKEAAREL